MGVAKRNAIVFATDRAWFPVAAYQATYIASLGLPPDTDIVIATEPDDGVRLAIDHGTPFQPLLVDPDWIARLPLRDGMHLTQATYYRYFLPRLLGETHRRLLYLDVDIHVHSSRLFGLFGVDMNGHAIGAVRDLLPFRGERHSETELRNTLSSAHLKYLNAGVLLMDPTAFVEQELESRLLAATRNRQLYLQDQSALNIVLDGNWLELSPAFNTFAELLDGYVPKVCDPVVVHFIGEKKPWHGPRFKIAHPAKTHVERYFRSSPWPNFLAQFYGFKDAWQQLAQEPARRTQSRPQVALAPAFIEHLRSTRFADVEAGVTTLKFDAMPVAGARPVGTRPAPPETTSP